MDFVNELVRKRGKENLPKFVQFVVGIFTRYSIVAFLLGTYSPSCVLLKICFSIVFSYDAAPAEHKPYRQKDGAMLAVGSLCDKLKQTDPYKSELERMLVQHIFPEFSSPVGHLRAKVFIVFGFRLCHGYLSYPWLPLSAYFSVCLRILCIIAYLLRYLG